MTYVKNISNWPDPGGQKMDMTKNRSLLRHKGNFLENLKTTEAHKYAQNITGELLFYQL